MTKEEFEKLKQTVNYFGHWYDVIGEERVSILEKSIKYIAELEAQIEKMKMCEICEYGNNVCRICYSEKPCNNRDKWKLSHRYSENKVYIK